ncbi:MAG: hypothetical protein MR598_02985 [Erysipelotrichaceae bacterium]|nr:hypothetical protein [Erysipelotrichaceae bacterium]
MKKTNYRYVKDMILNLIIFFILFFMLYYLFGILIGFAKTSNYLNWYGIKTCILPIVLPILLTEYLRWEILTKVSENIFLMIFNHCIFYRT